MTLLLDTHAFLWWLDDPQLLSKAARKAIQDGKNTVYISAAVAWEIAIKRSLGKLDAPDDLEAAMAANRFLPLPLTIPHTLAVQEGVTPRNGQNCTLRVRLACADGYRRP
jgi:PIN domain nuclease of toxin-antitoxin system